MAVTAIWYGKAFLSMLNKEIEADADTFKIALLDSGYTPSQDTHDYFDDVVADEISGTGYTAGGATLASFAATYDAGTNTIKLDATDASWASSTITARYAVIYDSTPATDATRPLLVLIDFGADVSTTNGTFTITFNASGIATITVS